MFTHMLPAEKFVENSDPGLKAKSMRKLIITFLFSSLCLTGCISKYHIGGNIIDEGIVLHRPVPRKVDKITKGFEEECIKAILSCNIEKIKELSSTSLYVKLQNEPLDKEIQNIMDKHQLNGDFKISRLTNQSFYMDDIISQDPFQIYEFIYCEYDAYGKDKVKVCLYYQRNKIIYQLWGFEIRNPDPNVKEPYLKYHTKEIKRWWTFGQ